MAYLRLSIENKRKVDINRDQLQIEKKVQIYKYYILSHFGADFKRKKEENSTEEHSFTVPSIV